MTFVNLLCMVVFFSSWQSLQQHIGHMPVPPLPAQQMPEARAPKPGSAEYARQQQLAQERKTKLMQDSHQLSAMTAELKQMLDTTPAGTLSMQALQKAEAIEKLAKKLHKEMQGK